MITIPANDSVCPVTVDHDTDWPIADGHVALKSVGEHIVVDGQALANALATLGYTATDDMPPTDTGINVLSELVDRLADRVTALEAATSPREPREGDQYRDSDGDVWAYIYDGHIQMVDGARLVRTLDYVNRQYGPVARIQGDAR